MVKETTSLAELLIELRQNEDFRQAERDVAPYYDLATEIIKRRNILGLTQQELARHAGTHQSRISKIESGEQDVRISTIIQIADTLESQVKIMLVPKEPFTQNEDPYETFFKSKSKLSNIYEVFSDPS